MEPVPETRYATGSGVSIAYQAFGHGPPLVMVPPWPSHLDLLWIDAGYAEILRLARRAPGVLRAAGRFRDSLGT